MPFPPPNMIQHEIKEHSYQIKTVERCEVQMSDTPLTDAVNLHLTRREYVKPTMRFGEYGKSLELRVNDSQRNATNSREEVNSLKESIRDQEHHIMELERLRRYSPRAHMGQD